MATYRIKYKGTREMFASQAIRDVLEPIATAFKNTALDFTSNEPKISSDDYKDKMSCEEFRQHFNTIQSIQLTIQRVLERVTSESLPAELTEQEKRDCPMEYVLLRTMYSGSMTGENQKRYEFSEHQEMIYNLLDNINYNAKRFVNQGLSGLLEEGDKKEGARAYYVASLRERTRILVVRLMKDFAEGPFRKEFRSIITHRRHNTISEKLLLLLLEHDAKEGR